MDLFKLMELQEIDKRLMELESYKGDLPEQVEGLKSRISGFQHELTNNQQALDETKKLNRTVEMDIKTLNDKLEKCQERIYSVKTNKEYDAITSELETLEEQVEKTEIKGVEALELEERLTAEVTRLEEKLAALEQELGKRELELQDKLNQTESEQCELSSKRDDIVPKIDRRLLLTYDRIRKGKDGIALAEINNYNCGSCYTTIPAQTVVEVRKMDKIISCEVCGRILVSVNNRVKQPQENDS